MPKSIFISSEFNSDPDHVNLMVKTVKELGLEPFSPEADFSEIRQKAIDSYDDMKVYMEEIKDKIISCDYFLVDGSGTVSNVGLEAGAAWILNKPIIVASSGDEPVSESMLGVADEVVIYSDYLELKEGLLAYMKKRS